MNIKLALHFTIICLIVYISCLTGVKNDIFAEGTSILVILLSSYCLLRKGQPPFSLAKMFNLFNLFFFGFAAWLQFKHNVTFWTLGSINTEQFAITNLTICFLIIIFNVTYSISYRSIKSKYIDNISVSKNTISISKLNTIILCFISVCAMLYIFKLNNYNIALMLYRGIEGEERNVAQIQQLISSNFIRPMPTIIFLYYMLCKNSKTLISIFLGALAIFTAAPSATARLFAAAMYIPVVLVLFSFFRRKENFTIVFVLGLLVVFPFLNNFRHFSSENTISLDLNFDMFLEGHFDAFQNLSTVINGNVITYGSQLLGSLFFFVPRSMWSNKPVGSGFMIAEANGYWYDNISMPYLAEGYINFGIVGSIAFAIILALVSKRLDLVFWTRTNKNNPIFNIQYLLLIGLSFFIMRGDLLSGTAYTCGIMASSFFISKLTGKNKIIKNK